MEKPLRQGFSTGGPHPELFTGFAFLRLFVIKQLFSHLPASLRPTRRKFANMIAAAAILAAVFTGFRLYPHPLLWEGVALSTAVYDDSGNLLRLTLAKDDRYRLWLPLEEMPPNLLEAAQIYEDNWFYFHPGFNPLSLLRGGWRTYFSNEPRQGGSTITMQLARLRWNLNTRSVGGKLVQIARAVQLELCYSKDEILEAYLNLAPYGRNIEGVATASLIYFAKQPKYLTLPESLTLAVLPQSPNRRMASTYGPSSGQASLGSSLIQARQRLYEKWIAKHPEDSRLQPLFKMPLKLSTPEDLPFRAPHMVEQVLKQYRFRAKNTPIIETTLNLPLQNLLERRISKYLETKKGKGLKNAAALLVDWRTMEVKALVGSADFFDKEISGQINGTSAKRSPGSTLKPFIYALAIDQGILHPRTMLKDVPTAFSSYSPENFDSRFLGPVSATDALVKSRNIPAVYVASRLKNPNFYDFLQAAGVSRMAGEGHYGLALVLGGGEVSMQEEARLYAMLPNQGMLKPLRFELNSGHAEGIRLLSAEACYITMEMLAKNPRPGSFPAAQAETLPAYWKTGTSWGFRDAWSVGIVGPYVLVVWLGNFDNSGNQELIGANTAAPLFFALTDSLKAEYPDLKEPERKKPENVVEVEVCLSSGDLPTVWCPRTAKTLFIPGKSPIKMDTVHRPVYFSRVTGEPACPPYNQDEVEARVYEFWPSDLLQAFSRAGLPRVLPPRNTLCTNDDQAILGERPEITSPLKGKAYTLQPRRSGGQAIALTATAAAGTTALYWFVNDIFIGRNSVNSAFYWEPSHEGVFNVRVVDDTGRSASRSVKVEYAN